MGKHNWSLFSIWSLLFSKFSTIWRYYFNDQKQESYLKCLLLIVSWTFIFKKERQAFKSSDTSFEYSTKYKSDKKKSWRISVRVESQYSSENGYSGWPTPRKRIEEDSFIKSVMSLNQYYSKDAVRMGLNLNLQTRPSFSLDKHTCVPVPCAHTAPAHPVPTSTCDIHSTVTGSLTCYNLYKSTRPGSITVVIISDTGVTCSLDDEKCPVNKLAALFHTPMDKLVNTP